MRVGWKTQDCCYPGSYLYASNISPSLSNLPDTKRYHISVNRDKDGKQKQKHNIISDFVFSYHRLDLHFLLSFYSDQEKKMLHGAGTFDSNEEKLENK